MKTKTIKRLTIWAAMTLLGVLACNLTASPQLPTPTPAPPTDEIKADNTAVPTMVLNTKTPLPTATPIPTETPAFTATPTEEPATATPEGCTLTIVNTPSGLNIRSGPGVLYTWLGKEPNETQFQAKGKNDAGDWWTIEYNGQEAWVFTDYIEAAGQCDGIPVIEAPPTPQQAAQPEAPTATTETDDGGTDDDQPAASSGPLTLKWYVMMDQTGLDPNDENTAVHKIGLEAGGGSGDYTFDRDGQAITGNTFELRWTRCAGPVIMSVRVDSTDGQSVEQTLTLGEAFCPTPWGCNGCELWGP